MPWCIRLVWRGGRNQPGANVSGVFLSGILGARKGAFGLREKIGQTEMKFEGCVAWFACSGCLVWGHADGKRWGL
jgi:hypothetical protein